MEKQIKFKTKKVVKNFHVVECPYCGKEMESEYAKQLNFNYTVHIQQCKDNPRNMEAKDEKSN